MENIIDYCFYANTDYDIANTIYKLIKHKIIYIENNTWKYYENDKWAIDKKNIKIKYILKNEVCKMFIERSIYWNKNMKYEYAEKMSCILLQIGSKLKEDKYLSNIIKECKQFFIYDESK
jgi:hypothetical protein